MRAAWKSLRYGVFHPLVSLESTPWKHQINRYARLYNGKYWRTTRCRPYFISKKYSFFVRSRPLGRPIKAKFAQVNRRKRPK